MYQDNKNPPYTIEIFEDVGRAFCLGILDLLEKNPISRVPSSNFKNLENIKNDLIAHYPIFIPKKKETIEEQKKSSKPIQRSYTMK